jgi:hypothetical protein
MDRDARELAHLEAVQVRTPALFIAGARDSAIAFGSLGDEG